MKASGAKVMHHYRRHARLVRTVSAVLQPLIPEHTWRQLRVAYVKNACLHILIDHSVMLMQLQGMKHLLLASVQAVHADIRSIEFHVRPRSSVYASPEEDYAAQKDLAQKQSLSDRACQHLQSLYHRCRNAKLKARLEKMLARYPVPAE